MNVLLFNAGSSSLKCSLMESQSAIVLAHASAEWAGSQTDYQFQGANQSRPSESVSWTGHAEAVRQMVRDLKQAHLIDAPGASPLAAVGHRVVQGGPFTSSVLITPETRARISNLAELAPLHNPPTLNALAAAEATLPDLPQVAVFDTAFHATLAAEARTYAVPRHWTNDWGIRRYGFHGLSHAYCAKRAMQMLNLSERTSRLVICHLGHGCSATAVQGGQSVDTTMGFTPLEGLMMATRSGSLDPGILPYVQTHHGLTSDEIESILNRQSGLLGVSGLSADMRELRAAAEQGHAAAQLAIGIYTRRVRQAIGALAVTMGGVDAVVFTAGVGEHSVEVRSRVCAGLQCLGLELDDHANANCQPDADIATTKSSGRILVIATREDITMLHEVVNVINGASLG